MKGGCHERIGEIVLALREEHLGREGVRQLRRSRRALLPRVRRAARRAGAGRDEVRALRLRSDAMPVIRLKDATFERLKEWAVPLEDSPDSTVGRVLDAVEELVKAAQALLPLGDMHVKDDWAADFERLEQALLRAPQRR